MAADGEEDAGDPGPFDRICGECSRPIRWARLRTTTAGELDFYVDEDGMEQRDFHFHLPGR